MVRLLASLAAFAGIVARGPMSGYGPGEEAAKEAIALGQVFKVTWGNRSSAVWPLRGEAERVAQPADRLDHLRLYGLCETWTQEAEAGRESFDGAAASLTPAGAAKKQCAEDLSRVLSVDRETAEAWRQKPHGKGWEKAKERGREE